jgi:hypothetical protein
LEQPKDRKTSERIRSLFMSGAFILMKRIGLRFIFGPWNWL